MKWNLGNPLNDWNFWITLLVALQALLVVDYFTNNAITAAYAAVSVIFAGWFLPIHKIKD